MTVNQRPVLRISKITGELYDVYPCCQAAGDAYGISRSSVNQECRLKQIPRREFMFRFAPWEGEEYGQKGKEKNTPCVVISIRHRCVFLCLNMHIAAAVMRVSDFTARKHAANGTVTRTDCRVVKLKRVGDWPKLKRQLEESGWYVSPDYVEKIPPKREDEF